jgi:hypothetical protein
MVHKWHLLNLKTKIIEESELKVGTKFMVGSICLIEIFAFVWGTVTGDWQSFEKVNMGFCILTGIYLGQFIQLS